jgi:hypothetical protein
MRPFLGVRTGNTVGAVGVPLNLGRGSDEVQAGFRTFAIAMIRADPNRLATRALPISICVGRMGAVRGKRDPGQSRWRALPLIS